METFEVALTKDAHGLGITIAGYVCEREELSGIFIKSVSPGSAAEASGSVQVNDQIIQVDGKELIGYTNHQAVELLRTTGQTVCLKLARYNRGPKYEQLQQAIASSDEANANVPPSSSNNTALIVVKPDVVPPSPVASEQPLAVTPEPPKMTLEQLEAAIDSNFNKRNLSPADRALAEKWQQILGPTFDVAVAQLSKYPSGGGLGISLEGTVDVEGGKEVRPRHFVR